MLSLVSWRCASRDSYSLPAATKTEIAKRNTHDRVVATPGDENERQQRGKRFCQTNRTTYNPLRISADLCISGRTHVPFWNSPRGPFPAGRALVLLAAKRQAAGTPRAGTTVSRSATTKRPAAARNPRDRPCTWLCHKRVIRGRPGRAGARPWNHRRPITAALWHRHQGAPRAAFFHPLAAASPCARE